MPPTEKGRMSSSINSLLHFISRPQQCSYHRSARARCAVRNNLPQAGIAEVQVSLNHRGTLPLPQQLRMWKHRTPVSFTPTPRDTYRHSAEALEAWVKLGEIRAVFHTPQLFSLKRVAFPQQFCLAWHCSLSATQSSTEITLTEIIQS